MPDSIFDMQQTLFTSNLPVPAPRDRAQERSTRFDQALDSAQRNSRDEHVAQDSQQAAPADNQDPADHKKTKEVSETYHSENTNVATQGEVLNSDHHDEVTLSQEVNETAPAVEEVIVQDTVIPDTEAVEESHEPTAEEISAAVVLPLDPAKPVIKQNPLQATEQAQQPEGVELNDAVQPIGKRGPVKPLGQTPATTNELPIQNPATPAISEDTATVDPNAVVVVSDLHSTKVPAVNKNQPQPDKNGKSKSAPAEEPKQQAETGSKSQTGDYAPGAFAVTVTPEPTGEAAAPKRRLETTRQTMPEVHESELKLAMPMVLNTVSSIAQEAPIPAEATAEESPQISPTAPTPTETPVTPNHLRGPQVPHSFTNHLEAAAAERKTADPLNTVERTRFVQRVARAFQRAGETEARFACGLVRRNSAPSSSKSRSATAR